MAQFKTTLSNNKTVYFTAAKRDLDYFVDLTQEEHDELISNWYDDAIESCSNEEFEAAYKEAQAAQKK